MADVKKDVPVEENNKVNYHFISFCRPIKIEKPQSNLRDTETCVVAWVVVTLYTKSFGLVMSATRYFVFFYQNCELIPSIFDIVTRKDNCSCKCSRGRLTICFPHTHTPLLTLSWFPFFSVTWRWFNGVRSFAYTRCSTFWRESKNDYFFSQLFFIIESQICKLNLLLHLF